MNANVRTNEPPEAVRVLFWQRLVNLVVKSEGEKRFGIGFLLDADYILTAKHVVAGRDPAISMLKVLNASTLTNLELFAVSEVHDLALCKVRRGWFSWPKAHLPPMCGPNETLNSHDVKNMGQEISTVYPVYTLMQGDWSWCEGYIISHSERNEVLIGRRSGSNKSMPGDSGTPVLSQQGHLLTVLTAGIGEQENGTYPMNFGVSLSAIHTFLKTHWPNYQG